MSVAGSDQTAQTYLQLRSDVRHQTEVDAPVLDAQQFVYHCLVCPLREQRRDRVAPSVQNKEQWRYLREPEVEQLGLRLYAVLPSYT